MSLISTVKKDILSTLGKSEMMKPDNATKGYVVTFKKSILTYTRKTNKWSVKLFFDLTDQAGINSHAIYNLPVCNKYFKRLNLFTELFFQLGKPYIDSRIEGL